MVMLARFTREVIKTLPEDEGAYELANASKSILYTGSSTNIRRRLMTHLISGKFPTIRYFRCEWASMLGIETGIDKERRHIQSFIAKKHRRPSRIRRSPRRDSLFDL